MLETFRNLARLVFGMNHVKDTENQYLEVVGNGLDAEHPRNARTLDIAGNEVLAGRLTVGAQPVDDNDVATKKYVDDNGGGGGGDNVFVISGTVDEQTYTITMDKTYNEIIAAGNAGKMLWFCISNPVGGPPIAGPVVYCEETDGLYIVYVARGISTGSDNLINVTATMFAADSATDYPYFNDI